MESSNSESEIDQSVLQENTFSLFRKQGNGFLADGFVQSPSDNAQYRRLELANGMEVLLISGDFSRAAVAVDVSVGSADNPKEFLGLAHFLEHMLFLGTKKYPNPESYQHFISRNGGTYNASTGLDHTNYYFAIQNDLLSEAMDRLAQFFIAPLFQLEYVHKELEIIESEYRRSLDNEYRAIYSATKTLYNPQHPAAWFTSGNKQSLLQQGPFALHQALLDFYATYYRAHRMKMVVVGQHSLTQLETMVHEHFGVIPKQNKIPNQEKPPLFDARSLPLLLDVASKSGNRSVVYRFPIANQSRHYASKAAHYLGHMIGHESPGSLLALLRKKNWASSLSAGSGESSNSYEFSIHITLTTQGVQNINTIHALVFAWIDLIREHGLAQWRYDELATMANIDFRWSQKEDPLTLSRTMARLMHYYPTSDLYVGMYLYSGYQEKQIQQILRSLHPKNVAIRLVRPNFDATAFGVQQDSYYPIAYVRMPFSGLFLNDSDDLQSSLRLPPKNSYIPQHRLVADKVSTKPPQLIASEKVHAWLYQDSSFPTPRANIWLSIANQSLRDQPKQRLLLDIYFAWRTQQFAEIYYQASLAGLSYTFYTHIRGMTIKVGGYDDAVDKFFVEMVQKILTFDMPLEAFENQRNKTQIAIEGEKTQPPYARLHRRLFSTLLTKQANYEDRLAHIRTLTYQDWLDLQKNILEAPSERTLLVHGEITKPQASVILGTIDSMFQSPYMRVDFPPVITIDGPMYLVEPVIPGQNNQVLMLLHGNFTHTLQQHVLASLVANYLQSSFFRYIRTERGLGYQVSVQSFTINDYPFIVWSTVSDTANPQTLVRNFERFLDNVHVENIDEQTFAQLQQGLLARYLQKPQRLGEESERIWRDLARGNNTFTYKDQLIATIRAVDIDDLKNFLYRMLHEDVEKNRMWIYSGDALTVPILTAGVK